MCCVKSRMTVLYEDIAGVASCGILSMHHTHNTTQHTHTDTCVCTHTNESGHTRPCLSQRLPSPAAGKHNGYHEKHKKQYFKW